MENLEQVLAPFTRRDIPPNPELDAWVAERFAGKRSLGEIMAALNQCSLELTLCEDGVAAPGGALPHGPGRDPASCSGPTRGGPYQKFSTGRPWRPTL